MNYIVIIEKGVEGYGAYVPDLPGCAVAADSVEEVRDLIRDAIAMHIEDLQATGQPVPPPTSTAESVRVA